MIYTLALDLWDGYGPKQRRFDSIHQEWDICTEFDPNDISDFNRWETEDGNDIDQLFNDDPIIRGAAARGPLVAPPSINSSDLERNVQELLAEEAELMSADCVPMLEILHQQLGFIPAVDANPPDQSWIQNKVLICSFDLEDKYATAVQAFVRCFAAYKPADNAQWIPPPSEQWDLSNSNSRSLSGRVDTAEITVIQTTLDEETVYEVISKALDVSWRMFIHDANTVLQIIRMSWGPSLKQIAMRLLAQGIPFRTLIWPTRPIRALQGRLY